MSSLLPLLPDLWLFRDVVNVYVLRDGDRALLIDFGDGEVLRHLPEIGVRRVDLVAFTHHHREQCQGHPALQGLNARIAAPAAEADLFNDPAAYFRQFSQFCVEGAPYARPPREPIPVNILLQDGDALDWGPFRLACDHAPGHSPGMMVYRTRIAGKHVAFCGDLLRDDERLDSFYDSEWDYGFGAGMSALLRSIRLLAETGPDLLLPSHGAAPLGDAPERLKRMTEKLQAFIPLYLRDWDMVENLFQSRSVSVPTDMPGVRRISPHLYSLVGSVAGHNAYVLLSETGRGLMIDAGIFSGDAERWLESKLEMMRASLGLTGIDAALITHYHGDHLLQAPYLKRRGIPIWTHEAVREPLEFPRRRNLTCLPPNYGISEDAVKPDRILQEGEWLRWHEYSLQAVHLPGQTEFAAGYCGAIDGAKVCFTGDNLFASPNGSGHDAFIARNRGILEEGYLKCAEVLLRLNPDLILGGHAQEIPEARRQIEALHAWAIRFREALRGLGPYSDYEYLIDPYWIEFMPYRLDVGPDESAEATLSLTNHRSEPSKIECRLIAPIGWRIEPDRIEATVPAKRRIEAPIRVSRDSGIPPDFYPLTIDVTLNGERLGEKFDSRLHAIDPSLKGDEHA